MRENESYLVKTYGLFTFILYESMQSKFPGRGCIQKLQNDALFVMKEQRGASIVTMMNMMAR